MAEAGCPSCSGPPVHSRPHPFRCAQHQPALHASAHAARGHLKTGGTVSAPSLIKSAGSLCGCVLRQCLDFWGLERLLCCWQRFSTGSRLSACASCCHNMTVLGSTILRVLPLTCVRVCTYKINPDPVLTASQVPVLLDPPFTGASWRHSCVPLLCVVSHRLPAGVTLLWHHELGLTVDAITQHYDVPALALAHLSLPPSQVCWLGQVDAVMSHLHQV
jgi:hypothetical protein